MDLSAKDMVKGRLIDDPLFFIAYFHRKLMGEKFIVGDHHRAIADVMKRIVSGELKKVIINIAPRYSKTELISIGLASYGFAVNPKCNFIETSYSADLTARNSMRVKDIIKSEWFRYLFGARIKEGMDTQTEWQTTQGGGFYATSSLGQLTGFGAGSKNDTDAEGRYRFTGAIIIDDPIKPVDALSDTKRESVNNWFYNTLRSRANSRNTPIVVIMQRLHEHDICGFLQSKEPDQWHVLSLPCIYTDDNGNEAALWPQTHTLEELYAMREADPYTFETQYQQNPTPMEGLMYGEFNTYTDLPEGGEDKCYCDPADVGTDFHCAIFYREHKGYCYVTDVMYTQDDMDVTEPQMVQKLYTNHTTDCAIEANGAGRLYAKNVERRCREQGNTYTRFTTFAQTQNKQVRIYSNANAVNNVVVMPVGWERKWPKYHSAMKSFRKEGRNANDDAPDATTGVVERMNSTNKDLTGFFYGT